MSTSEHGAIKVRPIPDEIEKLRNAWFRYYHRWWFIHYSLGILATVASITVASWPQSEIHVPYMLGTLSWIAAVCVALLTFLLPSKRAKAYVAAWRILHKACNTYSLDDNSNVSMLVEAVNEGEKHIANSDPL